MHVSRKSRSISFILLMGTFSACATSSYQVVGLASFRTEIQATSDRIFVECEDIKDHENAADPDGNYGFMIHVLDEENTVFSFIIGRVISRKDCFERLADINKILKGGKSIYIGGHGVLEDQPRRKSERSYSSFGKKGTFYGNGRVLQFSVIQNENGKCHSFHNGSDEPCMPKEFPIKK